MAIADRVGIGFGQRLTGAQGRDCRVGRVNAEAVGTVGIHGQRAGAAHQRHADRTTGQAGHTERVCIHIAVIAQDSAGHRRRGRLAQTVAVVLRDRRIIDRRHSHQSTIIASQYEPAEWLDQIPIPVAAEAITDRLAAQAYKIIIRGNTSKRLVG